jgi:hypothetical protein
MAVVSEQANDYWNEYQDKKPDQTIGFKNKNSLYDNSITKEMGLVSTHRKAGRPPEFRSIQIAVGISWLGLRPPRNLKYWWLLQFSRLGIHI